MRGNLKMDEHEGFPQTRGEVENTVPVNLCKVPLNVKRV